MFACTPHRTVYYHEQVLAVLLVVSSVTVKSYLTISNGVIGDPEVHCGNENITLSLQTEQPFKGRIFIKGHAGDDGCVQIGNSDLYQDFSVRFDGCGVRRQREMNGVVIITTIIVSFHSIFITKVDRAYRTSCFYLETSRVVHQQIDVGELTTELLKTENAIPSCRYEILYGGPSGPPASFARIGEKVYHKWSCEDQVPEMYCMRVHTCTVYDGQGGPPVTVIDSNGCSVDMAILPQVDYTDDLSAGQTSSVFKFADRVGLYFNCQIQLRLKDPSEGCHVAKPQCLLRSDQTTERENIHNSVGEQKYPTKEQDNQEEVEPSTHTSESVRFHPERDHQSGYPTRPFHGSILSTTYSTTGTDSSWPSDDHDEFVLPLPTDHDEFVLPLPADSRAGSIMLLSMPKAMTESATTFGAVRNEDVDITTTTRTTTEPVDSSGEIAPHIADKNIFEKLSQVTVERTGGAPPGLRPNFSEIRRMSQRSAVRGIDQSTTETAWNGGPESTMAVPEAHIERETPLANSETLHLNSEVTKRLRREKKTRVLRSEERRPLALHQNITPGSRRNLVADFDLPEKGLIVLGLEEGDDEAISRYFPSQSDFSLEGQCSDRRDVLVSRLLLILGTLLLSVSLLLAVLSLIIYRQRQLLKNKAF